MSLSHENTELNPWGSLLLNESGRSRTDLALTLTFVGLVGVGAVEFYLNIFK